MKDEDRQLFRSLMGDVKPHRSAGRVDLKPVAKDLKQKKSARQRAEMFAHSIENSGLTSVDYIDRVQPHEILSFVRSGLQHGVFKNLRLGKMPIEDELDLHSHTVEEAREVLPLFIKSSVEQGARVVLITHGHGEFRENPALLKSCVNHWLRELYPVMAFHTAQQRHGGSGATYVLLRKRPEKTTD